MKLGDLVTKRWGRIDPHQNSTIAICLEPCAAATGLLITGRLCKVVYPGHRPEFHHPGEFEVISEAS